MKRNAAAHISTTFQQITRQIDDSIRDAKNELPTEDFNSYRRTAGRIMGEIFMEILQPLYNEHPDLMPQQLRSNASSRPETTQNDQ